MVVNAVGNILGMVLAFLGGAWVPLSLMPEVVATLARFTPVYWYTDALDRCAYLTDPTAEALGAVLGDIGLVALFAAVVFVAAVAAARLRVQGAAAGANAAAALPTTLRAPPRPAPLYVVGRAARWGGPGGWARVGGGGPAWANPRVRGIWRRRGPVRRVVWHHPAARGASPLGRLASRRTRR